MKNAAFNSQNKASDASKVAIEQGDESSDGASDLTHDVSTAVNDVIDQPSTSKACATSQPLVASTEQVPAIDLLLDSSDSDECQSEKLPLKSQSKKRKIDTTAVTTKRRISGAVNSSDARDAMAESGPRGKKTEKKLKKKKRKLKKKSKRSRSKAPVQANAKNLQSMMMQALPMILDVLGCQKSQIAGNDTGSSSSSESTSASSTDSSDTD